MKAALLVGGPGTRMRPLTYLVPKPMLPLAGKPLLERTIDYLRGFDIEEIVLCVAYLKRNIIDYFGDGAKFGVSIEYAESDEPMGTAGQLKLAKPMLDSDTFLVMNGDIFTSLPMNSFIQFHREKKSDLTIALKRFEFKMPYGRIILDGDDIKQFEEKPSISFPANAGIYLIEPEIFEFFPDQVPSSLEYDVFPKIITSEKRVIGFQSDAYWGDIGKLSDYEKINAEAASNGGYPPGLLNNGYQKKTPNRIH